MTSFRMIAVGMEEDIDHLVCAKNDGFSMTETENYASKKCTLGEAERLCNFGKWDAPDYSNCCTCFIDEMTF